ncbi:ribonuclease PH [Cerasicoccus fimbriatus]|uniref:ribonuclease PH n=1 Tax=Cerasicoccus fimbriatus TaxID=3014554 RepID=UPI0022B5441E|nr:ribonuclease PH [Cerasicoccus sp. TK19100]
MSENLRLDGRQVDQLRPISFEPGIAPNATGSVLVSFGNTRVICSATIEKRVPGWMNAQGVEGGWITAEYSMLPYSTLDRKPRDSSKGRVDGRTVEIQRLIGRSMRAVVDLKKMPGMTLWIDCDVLQADGGTRTASITGACVAAKMAFKRLMNDGVLAENPMENSVAAVSVGVWQDLEVLDLPYVEDRDADVDFNVVMTSAGEFVEVQGTGEEATFTQEQLDRLLSLAKKGIAEISDMQSAALA